MGFSLAYSFERKKYFGSPELKIMKMLFTMNCLKKKV